MQAKPSTKSITAAKNRDPNGAAIRVPDTDQTPSGSGPLGKCLGQAISLHRATN
jgi:hypothetical protein